MKLPKKIEQEIKEYCKLNNIINIDEFILKNIVTGFNIEKYGNAPFIQEIIVEKEILLKQLRK